MKVDRKIFVGFDSKVSEPYYVCRQSLINQGVDPRVIFPLQKDLFEEAGWYWRNDERFGGSTEFTYTRFLVPFLSGFYGQSIYCDADFLWRKSPEILFDLTAEEKHYSVRVVKHDLARDQLKQTKMDGKRQEWYPRKNWSSMIVFNNEHPDCRKLTPRSVSEELPSWLHQFSWTTDIGPSLPKSFNYLVGYGYDVKDPYAVHFTDGGPWLGGDFENVEYAEEWTRVQQATERRLD